MGITRPKRQQILGTFLGSEPAEDEAENTERAIEKGGRKKGKERGSSWRKEREVDRAKTVFIFTARTLFFYKEIS